MTTSRSDKKYRIIETIKDDAPFGSINFLTISFMSSEKIPAVNKLNINGFKIHNGYNVYEQAVSDSKLIKQRDPKHDVYIMELGKLHAWDDATRTESVEYDDAELNKLDNKRRENVAKVKLMSEQYRNEYNKHVGSKDVRKDVQLQKMRKQLYDKGIITKQELDKLEEEEKTIPKSEPEMLEQKKVMEENMVECYKTDYLEENEPVALRYGCMSLYSPERIKNLSTTCIKVRGLFQNKNELMKRVRQLQTQNPDDPLSTFEIGKWIALPSDNETNGLVILQRFNYVMKCYLDNLEVAKEEFETRKNKMKEGAEKEAEHTKRKNKRERRRNEKKKNVETPVQTKLPEPERDIQHVGTAEDMKNIESMINFLDDPELRNKYPADKSTLQTMTIDDPIGATN